MLIPLAGCGDDFLYFALEGGWLEHFHQFTATADGRPGEPLQRFFQGARRLKTRLGPILYQLPPNWRKDLGRLQAFAEALPRDLIHVMEFRDRDWLADDTYQLMADHRLCLCVHDRLPRHPRRVTGSVAYVRFHGPGEQYAGKYRPSRLRGWADWIAQVAEAHRVFVCFNNDINGHALGDAKTLRRLIQG